MKSYCDKCNEFVESYVTKEKRVIQVKELEVEVVLNISRCSCGEEIYDRGLEIENDKIMFDAYKVKKNLLTSNEIINIRRSYGISQTTYGKILGLGDKTIARYETGTIQDRAYDNLMRLSMNVHNFYELFQTNRNHLKQVEIKSIERYFTSKSMLNDYSISKKSNAFFANEPYAIKKVDHE